VLSAAEIADARAQLEDLMTVPVVVRRNVLGSDGRGTPEIVWEGRCAASHLSQEQQQEANVLHNQDVVLYRMPVSADVKEDDVVEMGGIVRTVVEVEDIQTPFDLQKHLWLSR
jgi:hypothetical protein